MIIRYPAYYEKFHCIADRCEDTCCAGWEVDIDDESYAYYRKVPGEFGRRLRASIREYQIGDEDVYEAHGFILKEDKRCPFLDGQGLCELYRELGGEVLCEVCTDTPRNFFEYGGEQEIAISASCPEAGRLIFESDKPTVFMEKESEGEISFEESGEETAFAHRIRGARDAAIRILQNRDYPVTKRAAVFLQYAQDVQSCINANAPEQIGSLSPDWKGRRPETDAHVRYRLFLKRMVTFTGLESIREDWQELLVLLENRYVKPENGMLQYREDEETWRGYLASEHREYEYEHLLVYYVFLCVARCVDDYDFIGKAKLCIVSFLMIRDMQMAQHCAVGQCKEDERRRIVRIYAKEVEHSEENLERLADDFLFEDAYDTDNLLCSIV